MINHKYSSASEAASQRCKEFFSHRHPVPETYAPTRLRWYERVYQKVKTKFNTWFS